MDANLREHFERAVSDDPGVDSGVMAHLAIAEGGRVRRRRQRMAAAGVAAALVAALGVAGISQRPEPGAPLTVTPAMMLAASPECSVKPVEREATDAIIFIEHLASGRDVAALGDRLAADSRVSAVFFENRAQAYERFKRIWADEPDFVNAVSPESLPESFRLRLVDPSQYVGFRADYAKPETFWVDGRICPAGVPVGGVQ